MRQSRQNWPISGSISRTIGWKSVVRMPSWISKMVTIWQIEPYPRRIDAYLRLKRAIYQGFEHKIGQISCSTFRGKVMSQNGFRAKLCVRETVFDSSIQAYWTGDFMSQKWRSYGLSDNALFEYIKQNAMLYSLYAHFEADDSDLDTATNVR